MRAELLSDLANIGYDISVEEGHIKLHYQKPGSPPDSAKQLINEMKECKAEVLNILKTGIGNGMMENVKPDANAEVIWRNPYRQGSAMARRESLRQVMDAIWQTVFDRTLDSWPQGMVLTDDIMDAAAFLRRIKVAVLKGRAKLEEFGRAAALFEQVCRDAAPPADESGTKAGYADEDGNTYP